MKLNSFMSRLAVLGALALVLQACSGGSNTFGDASTKEMAPGQFSQVAQAGQAPAPASNGAANSAAVNKIFAKSSGPVSDPQSYRIGALDILEISVLGVADLTRTVQVTSSGVITLPLVRSVVAKGKTQSELEQEITARLSKTYLQNPQVTVGIKEYNSQRITVDGAVQKPGIFPMSGQTSLLQAIALAQGLTTVADPTNVLIFRQANGKRTVARFDIKSVRGGKMPDPMLLAGDVVMVDESAARTALRDITSAMSLTNIFTAVKGF